MRYLFVLALLVPVLVRADVVITEIMYDLESGSDSGREWIEIYNTGPDAVPLSEWKLFENGTNHKITGDGAVPAQTHAVIADNSGKFKSDWPSYSGLLFDSAFSLSNEGETLVLRDQTLRDVSSVVFSSGIGGNGSGDSLQRTAPDASFDIGIPTPGAGIPAGGLVRSPHKTKTAKVAKGTTEKAISAPIVGNIQGEVIESQMALISLSVPQTSLLPWLCGVFVLGGIGAGGVVWARHLKKDEWEIIEEV